jgi:Uncharacterised nucleotidyltransferase
MLSSRVFSRSEDELLLCCARTSRTPEIAAQIRDLIREGIDWEYLIRTAHVHGMMPLLCWHLDVVHSETVPESALDYLQGRFHANSLRNLFLTGELLRILRALRSHGVDVVPYKGPTLAASAYGNLALREFIDLDIMVHRQDVQKAKESLASLGYRPQHQLTPAQEAALLKSRCEYAFVGGEGKSTVELRWEIAEHFSVGLGAEGLWSRLEQISLGGLIVSKLSPEDTLLILCAHGSKHLWKRLGWICDVAEQIRSHQDIRWEQVMARARAVGGERMVLLGLFLASRLLGTALPEEVWRRVRADPAVKELTGQVSEQLFSDATGVSGLFGGAYFHPLHLKMNERLPDKIRYCARAATTQTVEDWELLSLPDFLFPLYYVLRPLRLVGKYVRRLLKRFL